MMSNMNYWIEPEKITESFVWYCYSKITEEQIEDCVMEYQEHIKEHLRKELQKKNPLPDESVADEEMKIKRDEEIEMEVIKNDNVVINQMVKQLKMGKNDWKKMISNDVNGMIDYDEKR